MSHDPAFDPGIPVLTEVVADATRPAPTPTPAPMPAQAQESVAAPQALEQRAIAHWSGEEWGVLERRVTERILQQLQGRVDFVLEQCLRDGIAAAVEKAIGDLSAEIRDGLQQTLGQVVARAVSQEIAHLQTLENKDSPE